MCREEITIRNSSGEKDVPLDGRWFASIPPVLNGFVHYQQPATMKQFANDDMKVDYTTLLLSHKYPAREFSFSIRNTKSARDTNKIEI